MTRMGWRVETMPERMTDERLASIERHVRLHMYEHDARAVLDLITELRATRSENAKLRERVEAAERVAVAYVNYHRHVDGIDCPFCSVGKDGACQVASELEDEITDANNALTEQEES
jgi:hypothetical protein